MTKNVVSVKILDDSVAEGEEELEVELHDPRGCLLTINTKASRWIIDSEDCKYTCRGHILECLKIKFFYVQIKICHPPQNNGTCDIRLITMSSQHRKQYLYK